MRWIPRVQLLHTPLMTTVLCFLAPDVPSRTIFQLLRTSLLCLLPQPTTNMALPQAAPPSTPLEPSILVSPGLCHISVLSSHLTPLTTRLPLLPIAPPAPAPTTTPLSSATPPTPTRPAPRQPPEPSTPLVCLSSPRRHKPISTALHTIRCQVGRPFLPLAKPPAKPPPRAMSSGVNRRSPPYDPPPPPPPWPPSSNPSIASPFRASPPPRLRRTPGRPYSFPRPRPSLPRSKPSGTAPR